MAKRKSAKSGSALDRQIAATRKKIAAIKSKKNAEKRAKKKAAMLASLKNKLKNAKKR